VVFVGENSLYNIRALLPPSLPPPLLSENRALFDTLLSAIPAEEKSSGLNQLLTVLSRGLHEFEKDIAELELERGMR
jgi:hypothetical protein